MRTTSFQGITRLVELKPLITSVHHLPSAASVGSLLMRLRPFIGVSVLRRELLIVYVSGDLRELALCHCVPTGNTRASTSLFTCLFFSLLLYLTELLTLMFSNVNTWTLDTLDGNKTGQTPSPHRFSHPDAESSQNQDPAAAQRCFHLQASGRNQAERLYGLFQLREFSSLRLYLFQPAPLCSQ